jgi:hypothetical protein
MSDRSDSGMFLRYWQENACAEGQASGGGRLASVRLLAADRRRCLSASTAGLCTA